MKRSTEITEQTQKGKRNIIEVIKTQRKVAGTHRRKDNRWSKRLCDQLILQQKAREKIKRWHRNVCRESHRNDH